MCEECMGVFCTGGVGGGGKIERGEYRRINLKWMEGKIERGGWEL